MNSITLRYKIPLLIALVVGLAVIALGGESYWLNAVFAFLGSITGMLMLDLEYILDAYVIDPSSESAMKIKSLIGAKDYKGFLQYLNESEYTFGEQAIRSVLFQILLLTFALYVITTNSWVFVQALTLSMLGNLLYVQLMEYSKTKSLNRWFWIYDGVLSKSIQRVYIIIVFFLFLLEFSFL